MSADSQLTLSDFVDPAKLFEKLASKTLDLMSQWVAKQIDIRVQSQFKQLEARQPFQENLQEAIGYIQAGKYEKGRDLLLEGVIKFEPNNYPALFAMGFALINLGETVRGLEHFEIVLKNGNATELENQTYFYAALEAYAGGLLKYQKYSRAVAICTRFNQIRPDEFIVWNIQADAHKALRQYKLASDCYQTALALNPGSLASQQGLKECCILLIASKELNFLPKVGQVNSERFQSSQTRLPKEPPKVTRTVDTIIRPPKEPPKAQVGSKEAIYPVPSSNTRPPSEPPKVESKYRREYTGK